MKIVAALLLLISFNSFAIEEKGFDVKILPDTLTLPLGCVADIKLKRLKSNPKKFSVGYACKGDNIGKYYMDFRLNDIDIVADFKDGGAKVDVKKSKFKSYTLYEITTKDQGKVFKFVSYCTTDVCLDLVGDYKPSIKTWITSQLRG